MCPLQTCVTIGRRLLVMLKQLGKNSRPAPDLVALLLDCHGKIRHFSALARAAGEADASAPQIIDACAQAHRYFSEALPLHVADEEESLLPRLCGRESTLDAALETMRDEHRQHERTLTEVREALRKVRDDPTAEALRASLAASAKKLEQSFAEHLAQEEQVIFPALARLLSESEQQAVLAELRARRQE
jgi:hemerythrin-like domain-containing protein